MSARVHPVDAGLAALRHGKLILLLAATAAAIGACAALPLLPSLHKTLVGTLAGDHFLRNAPTLAPTDLFDFMREQGPAVDGTRRAFGGLGVVGLLLQMFYAGGIVVVLGRGAFSFGQFFEPARRNFWHNVKCFFLFAVASAALLSVWLGGAGAARKKLLENVPPDSAARPLTFWILAAVALFLWAVLSLLYDFARAARRHAPSIGAWRAFRFARRALAGSWASALGLWLLWFVLGGVALFVSFSITWGMRAVSVPAIVLLMILQLGVLVLRSAIRVAAWGSYVAFLDPRAPRALSQIARIRILSGASSALPSAVPLS
jgi:hypothetical protein